MEEDFWAPRRCLREPIPEIFHAAWMLERAAEAHLAGEGDEAEALILAADLPAIGEWADSLWLKTREDVHRLRQVETASPMLRRAPDRMPRADIRRRLVARWGFRCGFCGIPVARREIRETLRKSYPKALRWGGRNLEQHRGFQAIWLQYDHIVPVSRGGHGDPENIVITCAPCNYGRGASLLEECGLLDPRDRRVEPTRWDGLERVLGARGWAPA